MHPQLRIIDLNNHCLFNLYAEYSMRNAGLEEAQAGIKISGRNINNLRFILSYSKNFRDSRNYIMQILETI